jgi:hypothetical protein
MYLGDLRISDLQWRKSRRSANNGACVEVAPAPDMILVRDSKNPGTHVLAYPAAVWRSFLSSAKRGDFDMVGPL